MHKSTEINVSVLYWIFSFYPQLLNKVRTHASGLSGWMPVGIPCAMDEDGVSGVGVGSSSFCIGAVTSESLAFGVLG